MLFAVINVILFLLSIIVFSDILKNSRHAPILRVKVQTKTGEEYRYFTDYAYAIGMLYTFLCALVFLFHAYAGLTQRDWTGIIGILQQGQEYYYFLSAISISNGFLIIPERSIILERYQFLFGLLTIFWLIWPGVLILLKQP